MRKALGLIAVITIACSESSPPDRIAPPFLGEYKPVTYTIGSDGAEYVIGDCSNDLGNFSGELDAFTLGNITLNTFESHCNSCGTYSGQYDWQSRCDASEHHNGTWQADEYGGIVTFMPASYPDSSLQFKAVISTGFWKLRYDKGGEYAVISCQLQRD